MSIMDNSKKQLIENTSNLMKVITADYNVTLNHIKEYYPEELKDQFDNLSDEAKKQIIECGKRFTLGIKSSIPMVCEGKKCCLSKLCKLLSNNVAPIDNPCPYEELMVEKLTEEFYFSLSIDPFNRVEREQVKQMVELMIIDNRTSADIAENGLYTMQAVGANNKGIPIFQKTESIAYNIKMKTQARIERIQNELLATRRVQKQFDVGNHDDNPSLKASKLIEKYKEIVEAHAEVIE